MKKVIITLIISSFLIGLAPIQLSAKMDETHNESIRVHRNGKKLDITSYSLIDHATANIEIFNLATSTLASPRSVLGVISSVITIGGAVVNAYIWLENNQTPSQAIADWVMNNYNTNKYTVNSMNVVYDTGCWKPEFPNNPFCRIGGEG